MSEQAVLSSNRITPTKYNYLGSITSALLINIIQYLQGIEIHSLFLPINRYSQSFVLNDNKSSIYSYVRMYQVYNIEYKRVLCIFNEKEVPSNIIGKCRILDWSHTDYNESQTNNPYYLQMRDNVNSMTHLTKLILVNKGYDLVNLAKPCKLSNQFCLDLNKFSYLSHLEIQSESVVDVYYNTIRLLSQSLPKLKYLHLCNCRFNIDKSECNTLFNSFNKLETLVLSLTSLTIIDNDDSHNNTGNIANKDDNDIMNNFVKIFSSFSHIHSFCMADDCYHVIKVTPLIFEHFRNLTALNTEHYSNQLKYIKQLKYLAISDPIGDSENDIQTLNDIYNNWNELHMLSYWIPRSREKYQPQVIEIMSKFSNLKGMFLNSNEFWLKYCSYHTIFHNRLFPPCYIFFDKYSKQQAFSQFKLKCSYQ